MAMYNFKCTKCEHEHVIMCGMTENDKRENVKCPKCGKPSKRDWSNGGPSIQIKGKLNTTKLLPSQKFVDVDGRPVCMNFIDHGDKGGVDKNSAAAGIQGARIDEATGKAVVDVVSNIPDPLGHLERGKQESIRRGKSITEVKNVNQKYKTRKKK